MTTMIRTVLVLFACAVCATWAYNPDDRYEETDELDYSDHRLSQRQLEEGQEEEPWVLRSLRTAGEDEEEERELRALSLREQGKRRAFDCNKKSETCKGVIRCCGTLQCYWPAGYSAIKSGTCVDCVQRTQLCQRDAQCCSQLVCQKGARHHIDGRCDEKRANGSECHEADQCRSGNCRMSFAEKIKGYGGVCS